MSAAALPELDRATGSEARFPGFPHEGIAEGWYAVGWTWDFPVGEVRTLRYFGQELIAFRTESGRIVLMDAYCPHLGAHMGVGGKVEGECIVCPFHGWRWNADGFNAGIPYSSRQYPNARTHVWHTREVAQFVLAWYSWRGDAPKWDPVDLSILGLGRHFLDPEASTRRWPRVRLLPQLVAENAADGAHVKFVHHASEGSRIAAIEEDGPRLRILAEQTFMTRKGPVVGRTETRWAGVGFGIASMEFLDYRIRNVQAITPIDAVYSDYRVTIYLDLPPGIEMPARAAQLPDRFQRAIVAHLDSQTDDLPIWESMQYRARPLLVPEERDAQQRIRKWARQFYRSSSAEETA